MSFVQWTIDKVSTFLAQHPKIVYLKGVEGISLHKRPKLFSHA